MTVRIALAVGLCLTALALMLTLGSGIAVAKTCSDTGIEVKNVSCKKAESVARAAYKGDIGKCIEKGCTVKKFHCKSNGKKTKLTCKKDDAKLSFQLAG